MKSTRWMAALLTVLGSVGCATRGQLEALERRMDEMNASLRRIEDQSHVAERRAATAEQTAKDAARTADVAAEDASTAAKKAELIFNRSMRK